MDKEPVTALAARGEHLKTNKRGISLDFCGIRPAPLPDKPVLTPVLEPQKATTMKMKHNFRRVERFSIDEGTSDTPPRRPSNAQQSAPGYLWNATTQEMIPILPEDHPDYRKNQEIIAAAIRRWNQGA